MKSNYRTIRTRYISTQKASADQVGMIKELFIKAGKKEKAALDYSMLNYYEASNLIKALKHECQKIRHKNKSKKNK